MRPVTSPYTMFFEKDGTPLEDGKIYFGVENQNPETSTVDIFADVDGTIPISQPVRTNGGYMVRNGSVTNVFVDGMYSITVKDKNNVLIYSKPSNADLNQASGVQNAVDDLGILNDGTGDQGDAFNAAFTDGNYIFLPTGIYNIDTMLSLDCSNLTVCGVYGGTVISSATLTELLQIVNVQNVKFQNIKFRSLVNTGLASDALVIGADCEIDDSIFENCIFEAPDCKSGGIAVKGTSVVNRLEIADCTFQDLGGYGISLSGTSYDDCLIQDNIIRGTGLALVDGTGIKCGAGGNGLAVVNNTLDDNYTSGLTIAGCKNSVFMGNTFRDYVRDCDVLTHTGTGNDSNKFIGNICATRVSNGGASIVGANDVVMHGNTFVMTDKFTVDDVVGLKATDELIDTADVNALYITGTSSSNEWKGGKITNETAATSASNRTILTDGAGVTSSRFLSVELYKESAGQIAGTANSATAAELIYCTGDSSTTGDGAATEWTPSVLFTDNTAVAYTSSGVYVKTGNLVTYSFRVDFTNKGSGVAGDDLTFSNFPFALTTKGQGGDRGASVCTTYSDLDAIQGTIVGNHAGTILQVYDSKYTATAATTTLKRSNLKDSSRIRMTGQYFTDQ